MLKDLPWNGQRALLKIFNEIWDSGHYPSSWKISKIIPLLKWTRINIKSYRPVALTSCLGKLLERIINRHLSWKLENESVFHSSQCGFRPKSGTTDALLKITEQCHEGIHQHMYTVVVLIDLEGAFDKVWWGDQGSWNRHTRQITQNAQKFSQGPTSPSSGWGRTVWKLWNWFWNTTGSCTQSYNLQHNDVRSPLFSKWAMQPDHLCWWWYHHNDPSQSDNHCWGNEQMSECSWQMGKQMVT